MTQMEDSLISTTSQVSSQDTNTTTYHGGGRAPSIASRSDQSTIGGGSGAHIYGRSIASDLESIPLHEGVGLQQLSQSPPLLHTPHHHTTLQHHHPHHSPGSVRAHTGTGISSRHAVSSARGTLLPADSLITQRGRVDIDGSLSSAHGESAGPHNATGHRKHYTDSHYDLCKYSFTFGGVTLALLEADPMHVHSTPAAPTVSPSPPEQNSPQANSPPLNLSQYNPHSRKSTSDGLDVCSISSIDEGGLDPIKYFDTVSVLLEEGINRKVLQAKQEELSQVLPNDHLL